MYGNGGCWETGLHNSTRGCVEDICSPALPDLNQLSEPNSFASWLSALSLDYRASLWPMPVLQKGQELLLVWGCRNKAYLESQLFSV